MGLGGCCEEADLGVLWVRGEPQAEKLSKEAGIFSFAE